MQNVISGAMDESALRVEVDMRGCVLAQVQVRQSRGQLSKAERSSCRAWGLCAGLPGCLSQLD